MLFGRTRVGWYWISTPKVLSPDALLHGTDAPVYKELPKTLHHTFDRLGPEPAWIYIASLYAHGLMHPFLLPQQFTPKPHDAIPPGSSNLTNGTGLQWKITRCMGRWTAPRSTKCTRSTRRHRTYIKQHADSTALLIL